MSCSSRTGLIPTPKKRNILVKKPNNVNLLQNFEALPMTLSLRPLGGLLNPFAKGCSVLCNHPAPADVKNVINQCKQSLSSEGKKIQRISAHLAEKAVASNELEDNIPEDLFRRYTDTDSRPLTPAPTVTSIHTRTSAGSFLNNRRCITPELGNSNIIKRKKIILDLRRSHSQETLYWKPCSDLSIACGFDGSQQEIRSGGSIEEKKGRIQKVEEQQRPKSCVTSSTILEEVAEGQEIKKILHTCINEQYITEGDIRRGKHRKKIKTVAATGTSFHLNQDPETQIATLGPDSLNPSTRPSLVAANPASLLCSQEKRLNGEVLLEGSFLTNDVFQALKAKLDVDLIEDTFNTCLNRVYREAYKFLPTKSRESSDVSKEVEKLNMICEKMPRKFSKSATRFIVPMDLNSVENSSVINYLSKYVWVSRQRKQIFKRVFLKHLDPYPEQLQQTQQLPEVEKICSAQEYQDRYLNIKQLYQALEEVLEFYGTENNIKKVLELINYRKLNEEDHKVNFRMWCGIVAFAERVALDESSYTDSGDEFKKLKLMSSKEQSFLRTSFFKSNKMSAGTQF